MKQGTKVRSDKKRDIKPTVSMNLKDCIYRISYITSTPVKDIAESICEKGLSSKPVIEELSCYFKRSVRLNNTVFVGSLNGLSLPKRENGIVKDRLTLRVNQLTHDNVAALAYSLDVTVSRAMAVLLDTAVRKSDIINEIVKEYLHDSLDANRMKELKKVLGFINANNSHDDQVSWFIFLSYLYEELKIGASNVAESIKDWLNQMK